MDDFASDTDSDYTSYWRDWVSACFAAISYDTMKIAVVEVATIFWSRMLGMVRGHLCTSSLGTTRSRD